LSPSIRSRSWVEICKTEPKLVTLFLQKLVEMHQEVHWSYCKCSLNSIVVSRLDFNQSGRFFCSSKKRN
jgi:hypothetical protein